MEKSSRKTDFYESWSVEILSLVIEMELADQSIIKQIIIDKISKLEKQLALTQESSQTVELDQTLAGRVSRIDAIQQQKMAKSSFERDKKLLIKLKQTLNKLSDEYYGICDECDKPISLARLKIKPESEFCIGCQAFLE